jgi:hypothetical protein
MIAGLVIYFAYGYWHSVLGAGKPAPAERLPTPAAAAVE